MRLCCVWRKYSRKMEKEKKEKGRKKDLLFINYSLKIRRLNLRLQKYKNSAIIFCALLFTCFLLIGTAAANEDKNAAGNFETRLFAFETAEKLTPAAETQVRIGNGSNGGGVRMQVGSGSSSDDSISLNWIFIALEIVLIIGLAYYLFKKK